MAVIRVVATSSCEAGRRRGFPAAPGERPGLEGQPCGYLERPWSARSKDRIDPASGLTETEIRVATSRCRGGPNPLIQRTAKASQVSNVEDVETLRDQIEPEVFTNPDDARQSEIVCDEAVTKGEFVRQDDIRERGADDIAVQALGNLSKRRVLWGWVLGVVKSHEFPDAVGVDVMTE